MANYALFTGNMGSSVNISGDGSKGRGVVVTQSGKARWVEDVVKNIRSLMKAS